MDTEVALQLMISQQLIVDPIDVASSSNYQSNCLILEMLRRMSLQQLQGFCEVLQARKRPAGIDVVAIVEGMISCYMCIYVTGFHITRLPHTQNQTYDFTRNGLLV